jgi:hypothetical protein
VRERAISIPGRTHGLSLLTVLMLACFVTCSMAAGQAKNASLKMFESPEKAAEALGSAYLKDDLQGIAEILGDKGFRLVSSGDPVIDRYERTWFTSLYQEGHEVVAESKDRAVLQIGRDEYPFPIPIVRYGKRWRFDPSEGHEDLLSRRISKAELTALNLAVAYVDAQREYHREDRTGDGTREYAQRFRSTPGRKDGLYWEGQLGTAGGPLAGLIKAAREEGYKPAADPQLPVYRGYCYRILKGQGPNAPGGKRDYVVDGRMTGGFALVAFPVRYGVSGIMTFMVNQNGVIYQKDLGPKTPEIGRAMMRFDPDGSWSKGTTD